MQFSRNIMILVLIFGALLSRFVPHPPNMTALGAVAIFSGSMLRPRWAALLLPLMIMLISDLVIGLHSTIAFVYGAWILIALLSMFGMKEAKPARMAAFATLSTIVFFLVSNFGVWFMQDIYPRTAQGLILCYTVALPFLGGQWVGDLLFTGLLFSIWAFLEKKLFLSQSPVHR